MKLSAQSLAWSCDALPSWEAQEVEWQPRARAALETAVNTGQPVRVVGARGHGRRDLVARVDPSLKPVDLDELGKSPLGVQVGLSVNGYASHRFPIQAELDYSGPADPALVAWRVREIGRFDASAVSRLLWDAVRRNRREGRMSLVEWPLVALAREAAALAEGEVSDAEVVQALAERDRRRDRHLEAAVRSTEKSRYAVALEGSAVGECNGLAVYTAGQFRYGRPLRVSCAFGTGRGGVVSIEKTIGLSGDTHQKGVQTLVGYLRHRHGRRRPLSLHATLTFEQSYKKISGDSASVAELVAVLSALSGCPVRQDLAITGSVDQRGRAQAVGGVIEKIEGFFRIGGAGVILPAVNVEDLVLHDEVLEAMDAGRFSLYSYTHVDEALTLLGADPNAVHEAVGVELDALHVASKGKK